MARLSFTAIAGDAKRAMIGVTIDNTRWMGKLLARLSDKQLADAFRAGGFDDSETAIYVATIRKRIERLRTLSE